MSWPNATANANTMDGAQGHDRMHEDSVNFITFFRDAAFKPAQGLNKIDPSQESRTMPAATMRGVPGNSWLHHTGAHRGHREQASANRGSNTSSIRHGAHVLSRAKVFASREPTSSGELPMASHQRTWTFMQAHRTVYSRVAHDIQGMDGRIRASYAAHAAAFFLVHTTAASSGAATSSPAPRTRQLLQQ